AGRASRSSNAKTTRRRRSRRMTFWTRTISYRRGTVLSPTSSRAQKGDRHGKDREGRRRKRSGEHGVRPMDTVRVVPGIHGGRQGGRAAGREAASLARRRRREGRGVGGRDHRSGPGPPHRVAQPYRRDERRVRDLSTRRRWPDKGLARAYV